MKMNIKILLISFFVGTLTLGMYGSLAFGKSNASHIKEKIATTFEVEKTKEGLNESEIVKPEEIAMHNIQEELFEEKRVDLREEIKEDIAESIIEGAIEKDHMP